MSDLVFLDTLGCQALSRCGPQAGSEAMLTVMQRNGAVVTITASSVEEALIVQSCLRAAGVAAEMGEYWHALNVPYHRAALGGVRVDFPAGQMEMAREALDAATAHAAADTATVPRPARNRAGWLVYAFVWAGPPGAALLAGYFAWLFSQRGKSRRAGRGT